MNTRHHGHLIALFLVFLVAGAGCENSKPQAVSLQMGWIPDAHQAGFWAALDKGYYQDAGLDVEIRPGGIDSSPVKDVAAGSATIGQLGGIEQLVMARAGGLPVRAIAVIHVDSPHALISLDGASAVRTPADLIGKNVAVAFGDAAELLLRATMLENGIEEQDVTLVPFRFDLSVLLDQRVAAITGFSTDQPATILAHGGVPVVLRYDDYGVRSYGYTLITSERLLREEPRLLNNFLQASRRGWEWTFENPELAVALMKERFGDAIITSVEQDKLEAIRPLMLDEAGRLHSWEPAEDRLLSVIARLQTFGDLNKQVPAESLYRFPLP